LKLKYYEPPSNFAFKCKLRRHTKARYKQEVEKNRSAINALDASRDFTPVEVSKRKKEKDRLGALIETLQAEEEEQKRAVAASTKRLVGEKDLFLVGPGGYRGIRCPLKGLSYKFYGSRCPVSGGMVRMVGGYDAHYRAFRCPL
jgi:hypothetical protein